MGKREIDLSRGKNLSPLMVVGTPNSLQLEFEVLVLTCGLDLYHLDIQ